MKKSDNKIGSIIIGLIFILVGVGIAAKNLGYDFDISSLFFDGWWTLFLIVPGVIGLFRRNSGKVFPVVLIVVGAALLAGQYTDLNIWDWVAPAAVIAAGVGIAVVAFRGKDDAGEAPDVKEEPEIKEDRRENPEDEA